MKTHPHAELSAYAAGHLAGDERTRVEQHLADCATCRDTVSDFRAMLERLAATVPPSPEIAWPRYRAELRARREARANRSWWARWLVRAPREARAHRSWRTRWLRPVPLGATAVAAAAAILLYVAVTARPPMDLAAMEADGLAARFELIDNYRVVDHLDLLEDLDVIRNLDRLAPTREG